MLAFRHPLQLTKSRFHVESFQNFVNELVALANRDVSW